MNICHNFFQSLISVHGAQQTELSKFCFPMTAAAGKSVILGMNNTKKQSKLQQATCWYHITKWVKRRTGEGFFGIYCNHTAPEMKPLSPNKPIFRLTPSPYLLHRLHLSQLRKSLPIRFSPHLLLVALVIIILNRVLLSLYAECHNHCLHT